MGAKCLDIHGAYSCHHCHDILDGRIQSDYSSEFLLLSHLLGMKRTQEILVSKGLI